VKTHGTRIGARSVSELSPKATASHHRTPPRRGAARSRFALQLVVIALLLAACNSGKPVTKTGDRDDNGEIKEHRDQWHPDEAQSDFLDIGKQAGIEWLSFVQQDQQEYPEYFEGLDRDQKRRVRLAPKESDERVLLEFNLPEGSKLWPVDWYGTELMAVELLGGASLSIAVAKGDNPARLEELTDQRIRQPLKDRFDDGSGGARTKVSSDNVITLMAPANGGSREAYGERLVSGRTGSWRIYVEGIGSDEPGKAVRAVLASISIKRELALEGSPKHKCSSTLEEQLGGTLRFPDGVLKLPIRDGHLVRKIGGDSTIQIDSESAEPWILIRRLKEPEGDLRASIKRDTTFNRRIKTTSAKFGAGFTPQDASLPIVAWPYSDSGAENELLGLIKAGNELLVFEVVSQGLRDGDKRRAAREAALKLLATAIAEPATPAPEFERLVGWNAGE
jgi:hypothetical protein